MREKTHQRFAENENTGRASGDFADCFFVFLIPACFATSPFRFFRFCGFSQFAFCNLSFSIFSSRREQTCGLEWTAHLKNNFVNNSALCATRLRSHAHTDLLRQTFHAVHEVSSTSEDFIETRLSLFRMCGCPQSRLDSSRISGINEVYAKSSTVRAREYRRAET